MYEEVVGNDDDDSDDDIIPTEKFLLSARIFEHEGVYISTMEEMPDDDEVLEGDFNEYMEGAVEGLENEKYNSESCDKHNRRRASNVSNSSSGTSVTAEQYKQKSIAKIVRQADNSLLLCLNTCRFCDYEHGHFTCGGASTEREIGLRIKHVSCVCVCVVFHCHSMVFNVALLYTV